MEYISGFAVYTRKDGTHQQDQPAKQNKTLKRNNFSIPVTLPQESLLGVQNKLFYYSYSRTITISFSETRQCFHDLPIYKLRIMHDLKIDVMNFAKCLLNTGSGLNLINSLLIHSSQKSRTRRGNMPKLLTAMRQPMN